MAYARIALKMRVEALLLKPADRLLRQRDRHELIISAMKHPDRRALLLGKRISRAKLRHQTASQRQRQTDRIRVIERQLTAALPRYGVCWLTARKKLASRSAIA